MVIHFLTTWLSCCALGLWNDSPSVTHYTTALLVWSIYNMHVTVTKVHGWLD